MTDKALAGQTAIVGIATSDFHELYKTRDPERTKEELAIHVLREACDDAGIDVSQIDGLVVGGNQFYEPFAYRSGLTDVRFLAGYPSAGRMCSVALIHAAMAVHHGLANYVAMFNSVTFRSQAQVFGGGPTQGDLYDSIYGMASPGAQYSLAFTRYQHLYGGTERELGAIPVAFRKHASMNPKAVMQKPFTIDEYLEARYVARPLRLFDYCLVNDGAVLYIVTSTERAKDLKHTPVLIQGAAERATIREQYVDPEFWAEACESMRRDLLDPLGVGLGDIDALQAYDNFSVSALWGLEGFGFAPRGEGLQWVQDGRIELGGEYPMNTSGGMLSEAYLQGWNNHAEMVRQLRWEAGERQVPNCRNILYWCLSAVPNASLLARGD